MPEEQSHDPGTLEQEPWVGAEKLFSSLNAEQVEQAANPARGSVRHTQAAAQLKEYYTSSGNDFQKKSQTISTNYEQNLHHCLRQMFWLQKKNIKYISFAGD